MRGTSFSWALGLKFCCDRESRGEDDGAAGGSRDAATRIRAAGLLGGHEFGRLQTDKRGVKL
jgi:hypothetical protein